MGAKFVVKILHVFSDPFFGQVSCVKPVSGMP